jgi:hypothetical protein
MADIFNFGGFLKNTNKRREKEAETPKEKETPKENSNESQETMSQSEFANGPEGTRRIRKKAVPPASMNP